MQKKILAAVCAAGAIIAAASAANAQECRGGYRTLPNQVIVRCDDGPYYYREESRGTIGRKRRSMSNRRRAFMSSAGPPITAATMTAMRTTAIRPATAAATRTTIGRTVITGPTPTATIAGRFVP